MGQDYRTLTENILLLRMSENDQQAFEEIYARHQRRLYQVAYNFLRDKEQAMDLLQDVFMSFWQKRHALTVVQSIGGYLYNAVRNRSANFVRSGYVRASIFEEIKKTTLSDEMSNVQEVHESKEVLSILKTATEQLPEKCREIFMLRKSEDLTNQQVAERLSISVKTVENQMTIALKKLKVSFREFLTLFL